MFGIAFTELVGIMVIAFGVVYPHRSCCIFPCTELTFGRRLAPPV
jgi:hypothetical protein